MSSYLPSVISAIRTDGFDPQIDRLFGKALRAFGTSDDTWSPACNAWEAVETISNAQPGSTRCSCRTASSNPKAIVHPR